MGWKDRDRWPEREPRPKVRKLSEDQRKRYLEKFSKGIESSPVLSALKIRVRALRGRFYFERIWENDEPEIEIIGRVTPLVSPETLLLEAEKSQSNWFKVTQGSAKKIIEALTNDKKGAFYCLSALDKSLKDAKGSLGKTEIEMHDDLKFYYKETGKECTVQETLYHYFGIPIHVILQPQNWYWYHRTPKIVEVSQDREKVLVDFSSMSMSGNRFGGRCLYTIKDNNWGAFVIRPNQSSSIESALSWLEKRKWKDWEA